MHLGDADGRCDLRLGQAVDEAQPQDPPLALVERVQPRGDQVAVLGLLVARLLVLEQVDQLDL